MTPHGRSTMRGARPTVAYLALAAAALGIVALAAVDANALCVLPALALAVPLLMRRYPGERALAMRLTAVARSHRPRRCASAPRTGLFLTVAPRGGSLIARSLAVRPPPALA
jgi:hypothetical protein